MTDSTIHQVAIIGAGTMGYGIAHVAAQSGCQVTLIDIKQEALDAGMTAITQNLDKGLERGKITAELKETTLKNLKTSSSMQGAEGAELVIEAAPEDTALKCMLFKELGDLVADGAIVGSNTSSLSVTELAASYRHPENFVGMHFFNPPHIVKLLELIKAEQTSDETLQRARAIGELFGRELVVVNDSPGFASSRLGLILGLEAIRMLQEGVASAQDIDRAMKLGYRHPMGPLELTDLVGLDVRLAIAEYLHKEVGEQFRPPALLRKMVRAGKLGKKCGQGFYSW